jgi:hypothetical protein
VNILKISLLAGLWFDSFAGLQKGEILMRLYYNLWGMKEIGGKEIIP